jgi:hypothetical protein
VEADYLRRQAENCLRWATDCFDLTTATRLRLLAEQFLIRARLVEHGPEAAGPDVKRDDAGGAGPFKTAVRPQSPHAVDLQHFWRGADCDNG